MRLLSKELQRFAVRPSTWWLGAVLLAYVVITTLVALLRADPAGTMADRIDEGTLATSALGLPLLAAVTGILLVTSSSGETRAALAVDQRRDRLFYTKVAAAGIAVVPGVVVAYTLFVAALWVVHAATGSLETPSGPGSTALVVSLAWTGVRIVALAGCGAAIGAALGAMLARWWTALLVLNLSLLGIERALFGLDAQRWSLLLSAREWAAGPLSEVEDVAWGPWWAGGFFVLLVTVLIAVLGLVVFRRRNF